MSWLRTAGAGEGLGAVGTLSRRCSEDLFPLYKRQTWTQE